MTTFADEVRRRELADFLRSRRNRVSPESVGITPAGRRRTPGLRREEVAQLASVGVTWYTWLEQGRPVKASPHVLSAIASALRLSQDERGHLFVLAGRAVPQAVPESDLTEESLRTILEELDPLPARIVSARHDVLAWNRTDAALTGDFGRLPPERRNMLLLVFTEPQWRADFLGSVDAEAAGACVAHFRRNYARNVGEPGWQRLIEELLESSSQFRALWERHDVIDTTPKRKVFRHPEVGDVHVTTTSLWCSDRPGTRLVVHTPLDAGSRAALDRLSTLGPRFPWRHVR